MSNRTSLIRSALFVGLFVVIVGAAVLYGVLTPPPKVDTSGRTRGSASASVSLVEYADFQ